MAEYLDLKAECKIDLFDAQEVKKLQEEERLAREVNSSKSANQEVHE